MNTVTTGPKPISPKQIAFLNNLMDERVNGHLYVTTQLAAHKIATVEQLKSWQATNIIGVLMKEPKRKNAGKASTASAPAVEPGYYWSASDEKVFQIVKAKSTGNMYAKVMVPPTGGKKKGSWEYAPGAMKAASTWTKMDAPSAAALGQKFGWCMVCGALLTKTESIEAGIGPICAGKF